MFYNEWEEVNNMPEDAFTTPDFREVLMDASTWILPKPYCAIIRSTIGKGKIKEYVYRSPTAAARKVKQLELRGEQITILTDEVIATVNYDPDNEG